MVKYQVGIHPEQIDRIFHSLADPTRRDMLERLTVEPLTVTQLAEPFVMSLPAISKHIKILEKAQLIKRNKQGREYYIQLEPQTFKTAAKYIDYYKRFWNTQLDNLEDFFQKKK